MSAIPLCVPSGHIASAKAAGAIWDGDKRLWYCSEYALRSSNYDNIKPFLPRRFRLDLDGPVISPLMVPQPLWGRNLRSVLTRKDWDTVRKAAYRKFDYRCMVCGEQGPDWPVGAVHEWEYDDDVKRSTLKDVIALCPGCNAIHHWGHTSVEGDAEAAFKRMMRLNRWTWSEAHQAIKSASNECDERSAHKWSIDYSWVVKEHGLTLKPDAEGAAEDANRQLLLLLNLDEPRGVFGMERDNHRGRLIYRDDVMEVRDVPAGSALEMAARMHRTQMGIREAEPEASPPPNVNSSGPSWVLVVTSIVVPVLVFQYVKRLFTPPFDIIMLCALEYLLLPAILCEIYARRFLDSATGHMVLGIYMVFYFLKSAWGFFVDAFGTLPDEGIWLYRVDNALEVCIGVFMFWWVKHMDARHKPVSDDPPF